jgi:hypothetical protein
MVYNIPQKLGQPVAVAIFYIEFPEVLELSQSIEPVFIFNIRMDIGIEPEPFHINAALLQCPDGVGGTIGTTDMHQKLHGLLP